MGAPWRRGVNGAHLLILVGLILIGIDVWDKRRKRARLEDFVEVAGLAVYRYEVHRVDRRVHPGGRRDLVVYINEGKAWFDLSGPDRETFLNWWEEKGVSDGTAAV